MFDIGFWELGLIAVVALLVIGPERLPDVARSFGKWVGMAKRFVSAVQNDINTEISKAEELKNLLEEQTKLKSAHEILESEIPVENDRKPVPREKKEPAAGINTNDAANTKAVNASDIESLTVDIENRK